MSQAETVTLIRPESGPSAVQLTLDAATIVHRFGLADRLDRTRVKTYETRDAARRRFENQIFRLVSKGYRVGADHPGLMSAIAEAPTDPTGYQVYADWLMRQGDPRAALIERTATLTWGHVIDDLLQAHRWQFLRRDWQIFALQWWMGFVHTVRYPLWMEWQHPSRDAIREGERLRVTNRWARTFLLCMHRHPSGRFVQIVEEPSGYNRGEWTLQRWALEFDLSVEPWTIHLTPADALPVSINIADAPLLRSLPGVGARLAKRIVRHRERIGGFTAIEQLADVSGMGPAMVERLRGRVRL